MLTIAGGIILAVVILSFVVWLLEGGLADIIGGLADWLAPRGQ